MPKAFSEARLHLPSSALAPPNKPLHLTSAGLAQCRRQIALREGGLRSLVAGRILSHMVFQPLAAERRNR